MSEVFAGIEAALSFGSLIANVTGVSLGILFGAMPGLTAAMGVALLIPLSFGMPPVEAFSMLLGMYAGAIYGGSITAILVGTPGTVAAAATLLEGPKLTAKGQSRKALEMATFASFFGGIFSAVALVTCAPLLATAAMSFGPAEYFALAVFALTVVATLSSGPMCKGLAAAFVGLFLSTVGIDPVSGDFRNTFDVPELFNGISLVPALVGLFAVSQVLLSLEDVFLGKSGIVKEGKLSNQGLTLREIWTNKFNLLRSSLLGTLIGIIPATGASAATFIAYGEAKRFSKHPEAFGKGTLEGVVATESSNNGVTGGALIPLMTLGVPGDVLTAILLGALMIQGLTPGPLLFQEHGATVNGIFASFFVSNILILVVGLIAVRILGKVVLVPTAILMSIVLTLCAIGSFAANNSTFDIGVMAAFGLLGYLMLKAGFPQPPMLLAMILGPLAESNFRRALSLSRDDFSTFFTSPISCAILAVSACVVLKTIWDEYRGCKREAVRSIHTTFFRRSLHEEESVPDVPHRRCRSRGPALRHAVPSCGRRLSEPPDHPDHAFRRGQRPRHRRPYYRRLPAAQAQHHAAHHQQARRQRHPRHARNRPCPSRRLYHQPHLGQRADRRPAIQEVRLHL